MPHQIHMRLLAALAAVIAASSTFAASPLEVTDEEVLNEYNRLVAMFAGNEYAVKQILVDSHEAAIGALARIKSGETFEQVAKEVSTDPRSRDRGGDLGWSFKESFAPEFSRAMVALAPGGISKEPVESPLGWHIIQVTGVRPGLMQVPPLDDVKDAIAARLREVKSRRPGS